jgi:hypothetical protein
MALVLHSVLHAELSCRQVIKLLRFFRSVRPIRHGTALSQRAGRIDPHDAGAELTSGRDAKNTTPEG